MSFEKKLAIFFLLLNSFFLSSCGEDIHLTGIAIKATADRQRSIDNQITVKTSANEKNLEIETQGEKENLPTLMSTKTVTPVILPSQMNTISPELEVENITPSPSFTITASPIPSPSISTPLSGYTFEELRLILSNPFVPPRPNHDDGHHGIDLAHWRYKDRASIEGVTILSVFSGVVAGVVRDRLPYGNMVIVESEIANIPSEIDEKLQIMPGQSVYLLYAHMKDSPLVSPGDSIFCGEPLGFVGSSGLSGNAHLHFEIRIGPEGVVFPEMAYYEIKATEAEREVYRRWRVSGEFIPIDPMIVLMTENEK